MYKILIKIAVVAAGLILFSAHKGAASISITPNSHTLWSTGTGLVYTSASSPGYITLHNLPSLIITAPDYTQPRGDTVAISISSGYDQNASPALGELDSIAWDKLEQPGYISVISRLMVFPAAIKGHAPDAIAVDTSSRIGNASILNAPQATTPGYALFSIGKSFGEINSSCSSCQMSSGTIAVSQLAGTQGRADRAQESETSIIDCAVCHMPKQSQILRQLPGVE